MATIAPEKAGTAHNSLPNTKIRNALGDIARTLYAANSLAAAESALDAVSDLLGLQWSCWNGDITSPVTCPEAILYCLNRGWPSNLMDFWQDHHEPLRIPVYIRCRFEHLPFVFKIERKKAHGSSTNNIKYHEFLHRLEIQTVLITPVHLPKGQIGMLGWAGDISSDVLESIANTISMELLAIGHHFMRIYRDISGYSSTADEEFACLTPREWDCLRILAQGYREPDAAVVLGLTKSTVRFHLNNVVRKFGCKNRTQAIALAAQLGLLGPIGA